jgi:hypothetical protein
MPFLHHCHDGQELTNHPTSTAFMPENDDMDFDIRQSPYVETGKSFMAKTGWSLIDSLNT